MSTQRNPTSKTRAKRQFGGNTRKARSKIGKIGVPIYAAQCEDDDRASPASLRFLQNKARNKASRFQVFAEGGHSILAVHGKDVLYNQILQFCGSTR